MPLPPEAASCAVCGARVPLIARPDLARRASDGATTGRRTAVPSPPLRPDDGRAVGGPSRRDLREDLPAPVARRAGDPGSGPVPFGPAVRRRAVEPPPPPPPPSVGRRVLAQLVDVAVVGVGAGAAAGAATVAGAPPAAAAGTAALLVAVAQVLAEGIGGATAGAAALGLRTVTHATGGTPGVGRALVRQLVVGLGALLLLVGVVLVAASAVFDRGPYRRGWHDRASGTRVVDAAAPPAARVPSAAVPVVRAAAPDRGPSSPPGGVPTGDLPQPATPPSAIPLTGAPAGRPSGGAPRDAVRTQALPRTPPPADEPDDLPAGDGTDRDDARAGDPRDVGPAPDPNASAAPPSAPWSAPVAAERPDPPPAPAPAPTPLPPVPLAPAPSAPTPAAPLPPAPAAALPPAPAAALPPAPATAAPGPLAGAAPAGDGPAAGDDRRFADTLDGTDPRPALPAAAPAALHDELHELEHTRVRDPAQLRRRATTLALLFDTGPRVRVVGRGLAGRGPRAEDGADILHVVAVDDASRSVSRVHLEFGPEAPATPEGVAGVWVLDRGSTNGTVVVAPDGDARVLPAGTRAVVRAGWTVRLGERVVRVEDD